MSIGPALRLQLGEESHMGAIVRVCTWTYIAHMVLFKKKICNKGKAVETSYRRIIDSRHGSADVNRSNNVVSIIGHLEPLIIRPN